MSEKPPIIREANGSDAGALIVCIDAAYAQYTARISDLPPVSEGVGEAIECDQVWVIERASEIIAGLFLVPQSQFMKLANLVVHPEHSGKGYGRKLIELAAIESKRQGYREMRLNTHVEMPENIQLYQHLGWTISQKRENTVSMIRSLRN